MAKLKYTDIVKFNFKEIDGTQGILHQKDHMVKVFKYEDGKKTDEVIGYRGDFALERPDGTLLEFSCKFDDEYFNSYSQSIKIDFDYNRTTLWKSNYGIEVSLWGRDIILKK